MRSTPGPWYCDGAEFGDLGIWSEATGALIALVKPGMHESGETMSEEEVAANARGLSATPDMLAALENIKAIADGMPENNATPGEIADLACAALNRAKGETNV